MLQLIKYILWQCPNLLLVCPLFFVQLKYQPVDNLTILNRLASAAVNSIVDQLSPDSSASLIIRSQNQQEEGNWWIENWFVKILNQRGISQIYLNQQVSSNEIVAEFKILTLGVQYLPTSKKGLIERKLKLNLAIRAFEGSTGQVKFVDEVTKLYADSVGISYIKNLEHSNYSFTYANIPENRKYKKYIEPFVVMITTAGIVYLFFHLRSN